jgi:subtilisin family serine protease
MPDETGRGVSIAVIDSGVHASHPHVNGVTGGVGIGPSGNEHDGFVDRLGHGTAVTAAIREKAPDAEIYAVKVFDDSLSTKAEVLVRAIDWASSRGVRLINLSLGTAKAEREEMLQAAVDRAGERGSLVVAASAHDGQRWLPGSLPGALGVMLDWGCHRDEVRITTDADGSATFHASGYPRPIPGVSTERNLRGISFAVANTTGLLARLLEAHPDATTVADLIEIVGE